MSSQEEIVEKINYYQVKLDRYAANQNYDKLVYIINKLKKIPIRTVHLELTGIGRSVNALRRLGGEAGDCCKSLVNAWKDMVRQEEQENGEELRTQAEIPEEANSSNNPQGNSRVGDVEENEDSDNECRSDRYKSRSTDKIKDYKKGSDEDNSAKENSDDMDEMKTVRISEGCKSSDTPDERSSDKYISKPDRNKYENKRHKHSHEDRNSKHDKKKSKTEERRTHHKSSRKDKIDDPCGDSRSDSKKSSPERSKSSSSSNDKHKDKKCKRKRDNDDEEASSSKTSKVSDNNTESEHKNRKSKHSSDEKKSPSVKSKEPKPVYNEKIAYGIDSGSGASFAEALGMCGPPSKSSKKKNMDKNSPPATVTSSSLSSTMAERLERAKMEQCEEYVPAALKQPHLEPLNLSISTLLPEITPNYKPLGFSSMDPIQSNKKFSIHDDEALSRAMKNKNIRTKVYSGNKSYGKVESLFDLCVRVLQDNLDALEYTGGVPFIILKPVLARATPDQLFNLEHHNPYLIEDTDDLWKRHCEKDFRTKKREELESSREMYMRCLQEREARLNAITANIKQSQDKSLPVRTTKLAYVDSVVKPPRNVARKQAKNGIASSIEKKPLTPTERLQQLSKPADAVKVSAPSAGRSSERASSGSSIAVMKPKKAPLMAKTLSLFKNRFKR